MAKRISEITIGPDKSLTLDAEILGEDQWKCFAQIFPLPEPQVFILSNCREISRSPDGTALTVHGTFAQLFPQKNVDVVVCLFDSEKARHAIVKIPVPPKLDTAFAYLSQYSIDKADP